MRWRTLAGKARPSDHAQSTRKYSAPNFLSQTSLARRCSRPGVHATFAHEHEYKRHRTVSLLAGIDLVTGKVHALRLTYQPGPHLSSRCVQNCTFGRKLDCHARHSSQ
jgi:hypothetical protein